MSEAARKDYFFIPPNRDARWSREPPKRAGLYWVLAADAPGSEPDVVHFDPETGQVTAPGWSLTDATGPPPALDAARIEAWWSAPLAPPPK